MMGHVPCILLLEWSTTSQRLWLYRIYVPYGQKDPRFLFKKRRGQPWEFWSLVSTIDGSTLSQDCVEEQFVRLDNVFIVPSIDCARIVEHITCFKCVGDIISLHIYTMFEMEKLSVCP